MVTTTGDIGYKSSGGIFDLFDNIVKSICRITDDEYDYIVEHASDSELELLTKDKLTFTEKRQLITMLNKHLSQKVQKLIMNGNYNGEKDYESLFKTAITLLRNLADIQNGAPLETYRAEWEVIMQDTYNFLNEHEEQQIP